MAVSGVSLLTAAVGALNQCLPTVNAWYEDRAWLLSLLILLVLLGSFAAGLWMASRQRAKASKVPLHPYVSANPSASE